MNKIKVDKIVKVADLTPAQKKRWESRGRPTVMTLNGDGGGVVRGRDGRSVYLRDDAGTLRRVPIAGTDARRPGESVKAYKKRRREAKKHAPVD